MKKNTKIYYITYLQTPKTHSTRILIYIQATLYPSSEIKVKRAVDQWLLSRTIERGYPTAWRPGGHA